MYLMHECMSANAWLILEEHICLMHECMSGDA